jgi:hypothetical protein
MLDELIQIGSEIKVVLVAERREKRNMYTPEPKPNKSTDIRHHWLQNQK